MSTTPAERDEYYTALIRRAVTRAGLRSEFETPTSFTVLFDDSTALSVGVASGTATVGRVMPSGNVTGQAVFAGLPMDVVADAVVAIATAL